MRTLVLTTILTGLMASPVLAREATHDMSTLPPVLKPLVQQGAETQYLGNIDGIDGYLATIEERDPLTGHVKKVIQPFYVVGQGKYAIPGVLFAEDNINLTARQYKNLFEVGKHQSPDASSSMMEDVEKITTIGIGDASLPELFMVVNPLCSFCHATWRDLFPLIANNQLRVRVIVTGFNPAGRGAALWLLSQDNPGRQWLEGYGSTDTVKIPDFLEASASPSVVAELDRNEDFSRKYEISGTPTLFFRDADGTMQRMQGWPGNKLKDFLAPLLHKKEG